VCVCVCVCVCLCFCVCVCVRGCVHERVTSPLNETCPQQQFAYSFYRRTWRATTHPWLDHSNESHHLWTSHVTSEWVMSPTLFFLYRHTWRAITHPWLGHSNESRHIWMSHVTHERVTSHMNELRRIWMCRVPSMYFFVPAHMESNDTSVPELQQCVTSHMNESCHIRMSHVTYEWVTSHMNESRHIWMSHVISEQVTSHMNVSCPQNSVFLYQHTLERK